MVQPEPPRLIHTVASSGSTALLTVVHDPGRLAREARGPCTRPGVSRDPTQSSSTSSSRGHRKSDAARPRRGGCSGAVLPEGGNLHDPLLSCGGTEGLRPSRYTSGPGVGQQHLRRARTPRMGSSAGSDAVRCPARQHRPARPNGSPPRWSPTDTSSLRPRSSSCAARKVSTPGLVSCTGMRVDERPTAAVAPAAPTRTDRRSRQPAHG
jgi:hypothetical protein